MRRQTPIAHQLYAFLFPHPTSSDPPNFSSHLARNLVPEVRIEVATFYGDLNSAEARYPGLNYSHPAHRMRLGRFKHHRKLFEAFDTLGLTDGEIQDFCCWEGTRWARERYEKDEGIVVRDTTGDEIGPFVDRFPFRRPSDPRRKSAERPSSRAMAMTESTLATGPAHLPILEPPVYPASLLPGRDGMANWQSGGAEEQQRRENEDEEMADGEEETETTTASPPPMSEPTNPTSHSSPQPSTATDATSPSPSYPSGTNINATISGRREELLNRNIIAAWEQGYSLPPELEQWLKEQSERGALGMAIDLRHFGSGSAAHATRPHIVYRTSVGTPAPAATDGAAASRTGGSAGLASRAAAA